jgi:hypothetical protein
MPAFGFSAFLKLVSLNPRPQRTAIRGRVMPSQGGYDYHRSFRLRAERYVVDGETIREVLASTEEISRDSERASAVNALEKLAIWREANPGPAFEVKPVTINSPSGLFKVHFEPNFGLEIDGKRTAIHIWNNVAPALSPRETYAALALVAQEYAAGEDGPADVAVLSVKGPTLYRLSDVPDQTVLANRLLQHVERVIQDVIAELKLPPAGPEDRPAA